MKKLMRRLIVYIMFVIFSSCSNSSQPKYFDFGNIDDGIYMNKFFDFNIPVSDIYRLKSARVNRKWDNASILNDITNRTAYEMQYEQKTAKILPQQNFYFDEKIPQKIPMKNVDRMSFLYITLTDQSNYISFEIINLHKFKEIVTIDNALARCRDLRLMNNNNRMSAYNLLKSQSREESSDTIFLDTKEFKSITFANRFEKTKILFFLHNNCILKIDFNYKNDIDEVKFMNILKKIKFNSSYKV